jgi:death-on-curing protein
MTVTDDRMRVEHPRWVTRTIADAIHAAQLAEHGGLPGVRDEGALESALMRPRHQWAYARDEADLASLAAAYGFALCRNHPYSDGNKRTAFQVMYVFLGLNGWDVEASQDEVVRLMLDVAAGTTREADLAAWIRTHAQPRT